MNLVLVYQNQNYPGMRVIVIIVIVVLVISNNVSNDSRPSAADDTLESKFYHEHCFLSEGKRCKTCISAIALFKVIIVCTYTIMDLC